MRKISKLLICTVLLVLVMFGLCACKSKEEKETEAECEEVVKFVNEFISSYNSGNYRKFLNNIDIAAYKCSPMYPSKSDYKDGFWEEYEEFKKSKAYDTLLDKVKKCDMNRFESEYGEGFGVKEYMRDVKVVSAEKVNDKVYCVKVKGDDEKFFVVKVNGELRMATWGVKTKYFESALNNAMN